MHRSGFVNIVGRPNVGKSTLMNALVGERMAIITPKPQTTRHRVMGILSGDDFQIVFSDTPGLINKPIYRLQEMMNKAVSSTMEDADIMLFVTGIQEKFEADDPLILFLKKSEAPVFLILNKIDLLQEAQWKEALESWQKILPFKGSIAISALHKINTEALLKTLLEHLPEGPEYYPKDQLTDRPERFFTSEIIREKILLQYEEEIPYSCEVAIESFQETKTKEDLPLARIQAFIFVARESQKAIILGKEGKAIKKLGTEARKSLEEFLQCKVFLELHVKVKDNWRDSAEWLKRFGY